MKSESVKYNGSVEAEPKQESNSKELLQILPIEDTPFTAVKMDDKWFVALGKYRVTQPILTSFEECKENVKDVSWERLMTVMQIMIDENKNQPLNN